MKTFGGPWRSGFFVVLLGSIMSLAHAGMLTQAPPPLLLPTPLPQHSGCEKPEQPVVRAALFGVSDYPAPWPKLTSGKNDVGLLGTALRNLGVKDIEVLSGKVEMRAFAQILESIAKRSRCGDTLLLYYSGLASLLDGGLPLLVFSDTTRDMEAGKATRPYQQTPGERIRRKVLVQGTLDSGELLVYFDWLRKQGINVFFVMDSLFGQEIAGKMTSDAEGATVWQPFEQQSSPPSAFELGAFFGIYIENSLEMKLPVGDPNGKLFGLLTYALATTLLGNQNTETFRAISRATSQKMKENAGNYPLRKIGLVFESTHPNRLPLAVGLPDSGRGEVKLRGREDRRIDITNPAAQRGAARISGDTLQIEGKVVAPTVPTAIWANNTAGKINPNGSFSIRLPVKQGENKVMLVASWGDNDLVPKLFTVVSSEGDKVIQEGKRYALIIANQDYKDPAWAKLNTPIADASALAERLESKFDFSTKFRIGEKEIPLLLRNATRTAMVRALSQLRSVVTPADSLLVFYAGHGEYEKVTGKAYWLPVDAEAGEPDTWLKADDVDDAIQRLNAKHVLVVADSCFSGGFRKRGAETGDESAMSLVQRVTNSMTRPSRMFISSGDNEPVSDGGGRGHSVFARALLDGFDKENKPFTAGDLFLKHVKPVVMGKSGQSPQYFQMKEGHEGGEFVFLPVAVNDASPATR